MDKLLISACYFGPVELYHAILRAESVLVDTGEHYRKQTYRTRTDIVGANGLQSLTEHIQRTHQKTPMKLMRLSYAENWAAEHWHAIRSAYGQSPWFIHYADDIKDFVLTKHETLVDRNMESLKLMIRLCGMSKKIEVSSEYVESIAFFDLRSKLSPKAPIPEGLKSIKPYRQSFEAKHGFIPRMSIIDLLMNMGPETLAILRT